jgi:hypothetical protein
VVLYGSENLSLTLREEHTENRMMRKFGVKRDEETERWRKVCNEELCDLYSSPNKIRIIKLRRMRCVGHVGGEERIWLMGRKAIGKGITRKTKT